MADDDAVRDVIAPMIETGFAREEGLLRHLNDHVAYLQQREAAGVAQQQELEDLPVAIELRDGSCQAG